MAAAAPAAPVPAGWVADRGFWWLITALFIVGYALPSLPTGLVFSAALRKQIADDPLAPQVGLSFIEMWLPIITFSSWIILRRFRLLVAMLPDINQMLLVLLAWMMLTALWAPHAVVTFKQVSSIAGVTVLALAFTLASWHAERFVGLLRPVTTVLLLASLVIGLVAPDIGIQPEDAFELAGSWRGISYQKNGLGQLAAAGAILWAHACITGSVRPRLAYAGLALSFLLIVLSRSSTSLSLSILSIGAMLLVLRPPLRLNGVGGRLGLIAGLLVLVPLLLYVMVIGTLSYDEIATPIAGIFGKDATFSGRTKIWTELFHQIGQHPFTGIGFNSFWVEGPDSPSAETARRLQWHAPSGHNGYIDMINEVGLIGFALFIGFLISHFRALARLARIDRPAFGLHLTLIIYVILANLTETGWFHPILLTHVIAMYSSAEVSRRLFDERLRHPVQAAALSSGNYGWGRRSMSGSSQSIRVSTP